MKRYFVLIIVIYVFLLFVTYKNFTRSPKTDSRPEKKSDSKVATESIFPKIIYQGQTYSYLIEKDIPYYRLALHLNTTKRSKSQELMDELHCTYGINGGFYDTDYTPIGLVVIGKKQLSPPKNSNLFNGYIFLGNDGLMITKRIDTNAIYGLQTGPVLISDKKVITIKMARDDMARRMVMGTAEGKVFIMSIFLNDANLSGPLMADLPAVVARVADQESLVVDAAINLDGGSASAIYTSSGSLPEINFVGSWWCIK